MHQTICVCGAGTMGSGIAQVSAQSGFQTILYDLNSVILEKAFGAIEKSMQSLVDREKLLPSEKDAASQRIKFTSSLQDCTADIFIEAIAEKTELKIELFNELSKINNAESIYATNTSSLSINNIASQTKNPDQVIGMHFFNPPAILKLVEVVNSEFTSRQTTASIIDLARRMGKTPVVCKDSPGFIVNRVARPYYIEALRLMEENLSDLTTTDSLLEATGFKMGPFRLMDLIGNDINYAVSCSVYEQLQKPERLRPSDIQKEKVERVELGRKSGTGYYSYQKGN
jgi:3-hydroxybutyryl-CoA dehydrogenase